MDLRVISIGALSSHPLRNEPAAVRTGHSTTTLIRAAQRTILVDPGLPESALLARLDERTGLKPRAITHVFLTSFNPELRRAITAFDHATWWIGQAEREAIGVSMVQTLHHANETANDALKSALELDIAILKRCEPAPDTLATDKGERVDLFPLPGVTPGLCGLIIPGHRYTTVITGDAIPTAEHLEQGKVPQTAADVARARESFAEAVEIADLLILGRDNLAVNPTKRPF